MRSSRNGKWWVFVHDYWRFFYLCLIELFLHLLVLSIWTSCNCRLQLCGNSYQLLKTRVWFIQPSIKGLFWHMQNANVAKPWYSQNSFINCIVIFHHHFILLMVSTCTHHNYVNNTKITEVNLSYRLHKLMYPLDYVFFWKPVEILLPNTLANENNVSCYGTMHKTNPVLMTLSHHLYQTTASLKQLCATTVRIVDWCLCIISDKSDYCDDYLNWKLLH